MNRLLIIDNNQITAMIVRNALYLKAPHIQVFEATNEKTAVMLATEVNPHLILLDFNSPMLHGPSMVEALRKMPHLQSVPIIGISPIHQLRASDQTMCHQCDEWLHKPLSSVDLLSMIAQFGALA